MKKIILIRTYTSVGAGGPVHPLELLYISSMIMKISKNNYNIKVIDMGMGELSVSEIDEEIRSSNPHVVCLNALVWEAPLVHEIAAVVKKFNKDINLIVCGQLPTLAGEKMLLEKNIDFLVIGEPEQTVAELLQEIDNNKKFLDVSGIVYRNGTDIITTNPCTYIDDLDTAGISPSAWDLIDVRAYAKYANWNGSLKEHFYIPILTSRGCPFNCTFCCYRNIYGKRFRMRSPENVFSEIKFLQKKYNVKEIHIFDAVFNYDVERAKKICKLIIDSKIKISLAFPHGIRVDIMTDELIGLLKQAGTYKLTYGIETAVHRLQKKTKKNLHLPLVKQVISKTAKTGIIVGGYFMLGFPSETEQEMKQTIDFARTSDLDIASFFKFTCFQDINKIYQSKYSNGTENNDCDFDDLSYFSKKRTNEEISSNSLNNIILVAQQRFYLNSKRLCRGIYKSTNKITFLKSLIKASVLLLQSYLIRVLEDGVSKKNNIPNHKKVK